MDHQFDVPTDNFSYDSLNRLTSIGEKVNGTGNDSFKQAYTYDRFGNRTIAQGSADTFGSGIPKSYFGVDTDTNRFTVPDGQSGTMHYDQAGNLDIDTYSGSAVSRVYDAENRMTHETQANDYDAGTYVYDGDGRRIKRTVNGVETWQVYGFGGELLAEYAANAARTNPQKEYGYRNGQLLITAEAASGPRTNFALASNGATATAQNYTADYGGLHFQPSYANDGIRYMGPNGDHYWRDEHGLPTSLEIDFSESKSIDEIDVYTCRDDYGTQTDPSETQTFSNYGTTSFNVQYWNGSGWTTVPGGSVTANNLVWRKINFAAVTTTKIQVSVTQTADNVARLMEVEAWGPTVAAPATNVALATNGATVTAQNYTADYGGYHFQPGYAIDGVRYMGQNGDLYWRDEHGLPTSIEVDLNGSKTINEVDVFTVRDDYWTLAEPSAT